MTPAPRSGASVSFIICANNKWGDFATPFINSILSQENKVVDIVLVDNGSPEPYAAGSGHQLLRLDPQENYNYMKALNAGAERAAGNWLIFCNDDILCYGEFAETIESFRPDALYGLEIRQKDREWGLEFQYIYGWFFIIPRAAWEAVGTFDEYYLHAGFDDLDYSWRAQQKGFALRKVELPFVHLADLPGGKHRRATVADFHKNMARSKAHFLQKVT